MLTIANVLALALIVADEPQAPAKPTTVEPSAPPAAVEATASDLPRISTPRMTVSPEPEERRELSLRDAIRIGLENSPVIRVTSREEPADRPRIVIDRINEDDSGWKFQAAVMAHVRSIEQQYWALWQQQTVLEAREGAVKDAEKVLARERAELESSRGGAADVAEAEQRLEDFKLNLVTATADTITIDRQLRNLLGLPPADNRRIIAVTRPAEARVEPDWEASLRAMQESQPDIAEQKALARLAELQLLLARNQLLPILGLDDLARIKGLGNPPAREWEYDLKAMVRQYAAETDSARMALESRGTTPPEGFRAGLTFKMPASVGRSPLANTRQAQYQLIRQRASLQLVTHQTTHTLARFFLEVDANYKQFRTAHRLALAARQRLDAQRAFYDEGRVTVERLLDAVIQQANAVAQEAQYLASYNTSIAALEEAKGTLLAFDGIALADDPRPATVAALKDESLTTVVFEQPAEVPAAIPAEAPAATPAAPRPGTKTFRLRAKLGPGGLDLEIESTGPADAKPASPASP